MRYFLVVWLSSVLTGCVSTAPTSSHLSYPPQLEYFEDQYDSPRQAIETYHAAMNNYIGYMINRQREVELTYNITTHTLGRPCHHRSVKLPTLPELPEVGGLPDEQVVDALIEHIHLLRRKLVWTSERNQQHNEDAAMAIGDCMVLKY